VGWDGGVAGRMADTIGVPLSIGLRRRSSVVSERIERSLDYFVGIVRDHDANNPLLYLFTC
jgi:hypothetical protein